MSNRKMGVLFLNSPDHPGADTFIHMQIMRALDRSRFEVHVACSAGPPEARTPAFRALALIPELHLRPSNLGPSLAERSQSRMRAAMSGVGMVFDLIRLAGYIRQHHIRVLHSTDRPRDAVPCVVLGKLTGAKSVVHAHVAFGDWMGRGVRWAFARADGLVAISHFVAQSFSNRGYGVGKMHVVLNAIDPNAWNFTLGGGTVRREFGFSTGQPVIACAARLFRWKGQADLIRAVDIVRREIPDVRLLIIGADDRLAMRTSFLSELKALVGELDMTDQVIFTGFRSDMPALLAAADVFALPSFEEPFGLVFLEAMAMKKPVSAIDNGGTPEVVEHGKSGLLSPPGDVPALATNLLRLLRDPDLRARMGEYGRRQVEERFSTDRMARDTERVYAELASA
jgi:glycosyltransferase involved in cell wall biosynthesis